MSYAKHERGKYVRLEMHYQILVDLGHGKINAAQAGHVYDLISRVETAGTTMNMELAENEYYIRAVASWVEARRINRERFAKSKSL